MSDAEEMGEDIGEDAYDCGQPLHNETEKNSTGNSTDDILECEDDEQQMLEDQHVPAEGLLE